MTFAFWSNITFFAQIEFFCKQFNHWRDSVNIQNYVVIFLCMWEVPERSMCIATNCSMSWCICLYRLKITSNYVQTILHSKRNTQLYTDVHEIVMGLLDNLERNRFRSCHSSLLYRIKVNIDLTHHDPLGQIARLSWWCSR